MNYYFFDRRGFNLYYNCSYYDINLHPLEERQNIPFGIAVGTLACIFMICYIPLIIVLWKPFFQKESCFRFMSVISLIDFVVLQVNGSFTAYYLLTGSVYCSCRWLQLIVGAVGYGCWIAETDLAVVLSLNRCLHMYNPKLLHRLFDGSRTNVWITVAVIHGIVVPLTTDALTFNPILGAWLFSPHVGYPQPDYKFENFWHPFHNYGVAALLCIFYIMFISMFIKKKCTNNLNGGPAISLADAPIFFQVLILSLLNFFVATVYCYLQSFPIPVIVMKITHIGWLCNHGLPSIINITLNATIRKEVFKVLKVTKYRYLFTSSTAPIPSITANNSTPAI